MADMARAESYAGSSVSSANHLDVSAVPDATADSTPLVVVQAALLAVLAAKFAPGSGGVNWGVEVPLGAWQGLSVKDGVVLGCDLGAPPLARPLRLRDLKPLLAPPLIVLRLLGGKVRGDLSSLARCVHLRTLILTDTKVGPRPREAGGKRCGNIDRVSG